MFIFSMWIHTLKLLMMTKFYIYFGDTNMRQLQDQTILPVMFPTRFSVMGKIVVRGE